MQNRNEKVKGPLAARRKNRCGCKTEAFPGGINLYCTKIEDDIKDPKGPCNILDRAKWDGV